MATLKKARMAKRSRLTGLAQVHWTRAARTDKGVHALGNLISVKLLWPPDADMVAEVNSKLPADVCVLDMKRVTKVKEAGAPTRCIAWWLDARLTRPPCEQGFNAKNQAEGRMYQYLIPSYAFMSAERPDPATCKAFVDDDLPGG